MSERYPILKPTPGPSESAQVMSHVVTKEFEGRLDFPLDLHPDCEKCVGCARNKYDDYTDAIGTHHRDGFAVDCPFTPSDEIFVDPGIRNQIEQADAKEISAYRSALLWAEKHLTDPETGDPWKAWYFQRGPLLCRSSRKVYRFGRRTGKCVPHDSIIALSDGSLRKIKELVGREIEVNSLDLETYQYVKAKATVHDNGVKPCVRVTTQYGQEIECTLNHPLLTVEGWKSVDDGLVVGDRIAVPTSNPNVGSEKFDKEQLNLLGYLLGDGSFCLGNNSVGFTVSIDREDVKEHFLSCLDGTHHINPKIRCRCYDIRLHTNNSIVQLVREVGLISKNSYAKFIPDFIYRLDAEHIIEFLWPLFTTDGWSDNRGNVGYCSASKELAVGIRRLLSRLGIVASTRIKTLKSGKYAGNSYYVTEVNNNSEVCKFLDIVGLRFKGYEGKTITSRNSYNSQLRSMPVSFSDSFAQRLRKIANTSRQREGFGGVRQKTSVGRDLLSKWANKYSDLFQEEKKVLDSDLYWDKVVSIEEIGDIPTAGLYVPGHQNYVNDVVEHNTTILAIEILWYLFTSCGGTLKTKKGRMRTNLKVLILTPQKSHVENIFKRIRDFLNLSPQLRSCVDRNTRGSPQIITLTTDSKTGEGHTISGFAAGDSSGNRGLAARGQDADLVILDEAAFVDPETIRSVVLAFLFTNINTRYIISSTPSGIAGDYFESICLERPDFPEFYVPSTAREDFDKIKDQMRREYGRSQEQWDKEVLALFSPAGIGVYKDDLVKLAQHDYSYESMQHNVNFIYTFGIDWNKEHGTEIVILATQKIPPHLSFVALTENIPKKEFTTPLGINRVVDLNRYWKPLWIYVDAGGGDGGQLLRHYGRTMVGKNIIDARLKDIVKDYDFGSKVEIREHDGRLLKAPAKQFMVENSVKKFELGSIKYARGDLNLTGQLNNYVVARRTPSGMPVYGTSSSKWSDHTLDALNLALVAIRLQIPSFQVEEIQAVALPIGYVPPASEIVESKPRIILPVSVASSDFPTRNRLSPRPVLHQNVVRYSGGMPSRTSLGGRGLGFKR